MVHVHNTHASVPCIFLDVAHNVLKGGTFFSSHTEVHTIAIRVVKFSKGSTKLERVLPKNQHAEKKLLNFEF